eukprot:scaffold12572_cov108-Isochrysis_galbana.AAC.3
MLPRALGGHRPTANSIPLRPDSAPVSLFCAAAQLPPPPPPKKPAQAPTAARSRGPARPQTGGGRVARRPGRGQNWRADAVRGSRVAAWACAAAPSGAPHTPTARRCGAASACLRSIGRCPQI